jgi:hypothetical protein
MSVAGWLDDSDDDINTDGASESQPKRTRGRPRTTTPEFDGIASGFLRHKTRTTVRKRYLAREAFAALANAEGRDFGTIIEA